MSGRRLPGVLVLAAALGIWEALARARPSFLVPPASAVFERAGQVWPTREFLATVAASLERLAAGYTIGAAAGIAVGILMGASPAARRSLEPLAEFLRALPPIAIVPVAVVVLGLGNGMRIAVIAFGVCFPVLVNAWEGVRTVSPEARDTAAMLHVRGRELLYRFFLPAALPSIVAGLRGFQQSQFNVPELYGGILFLGLLGYVLNTLFLVAERRLLAWHDGAAGEPVR